MSDEPAYQCTINIRGDRPQRVIVVHCWKGGYLQIFENWQLDLERLFLIRQTSSLCDGCWHAIFTTLEPTTRHN